MQGQIREDDDHLGAGLKLAALSGLGQGNRRRLLAHFPDPRAIFETPIEDLKALLLVPGGRIREALAAIDEDRVARQLQLLRQHDISILPSSSPAYPERLKELPDAPALLFTQGCADLLSGPQLAMVGSRNASPSGLRTAQAFAADFSAAGLTITSGLASGIDSAAHRGALQQIGGTIAVVATGLDEVYPRQNRSLATEILDRGCLVSEYPPLTPARRTQFPQRNRIISGLALGVLVVEADTRSGSLITARLAGEQGREVFAIPGSIHQPTSRGCHQLIRQGAKLVETTGDVLVELKPQLENLLRTRPDHAPISSKREKPLDPDAKKVLNQVDFAPTRLEDIAVHSNLPVELVSSKLLQLELAGRVSPLPGGRYQRIPD